MADAGVEARLTPLTTSMTARHKRAAKARQGFCAEWATGKLQTHYARTEAIDPLLDNTPEARRMPPQRHVLGCAKH
ncbi:hypothetical protein GCM10007989_03830 [Devosia pacifica]|uniref:Uncharacterized protein n=1 Tax=Devosia pacifica TaxID=1335967 RepID=A0A918RTU6_9HYPH|nr:hypothetical protein GCM10007989_03830 [Devosia pacifica]